MRIIFIPCFCCGVGTKIFYSFPNNNKLICDLSQTLTNMRGNIRVSFDYPRDREQPTKND